MRTVRLYGFLGARYGRKHELAVASPAEAVRALCALFKGFAADVRGDGTARYRVYNGRDIASVETLRVRKADEVIRIVPVLQGAKRGGVLQTILGAVLIVVGVIITGGTYGAGAPFGSALISLGVSLIVGGIIQMLTPLPKPGDPYEKDANKPSTLFSGPVNTTAQGHPVPLLYGRVICGSAVISAGISVDDTL